MVERNTEVNLAMVFIRQENSDMLGDDEGYHFELAEGIVVEVTTIGDWEHPGFDSAVDSFVDGVSWLDVFDGFTDQLLAFYDEWQVREAAKPELQRYPGYARCIVAIETVFEKSYCYNSGGYDYDAHCGVVGIVNTSGWNARTFAYKVEHPANVALNL